MGADVPGRSAAGALRDAVDVQEAVEARPVHGREQGQHASRLQEQVEVACRQAWAEQQAEEQKREEVKTAATLGGVFPGNACLE